ncbi:hypothetical protein [Leeuwenhoekiella marinoflava]|uniref:Uncharacterized protein n=2 Tax=Leeuwenhoekiella marinoflava TaxID=988 RepID=A0A4Q0P6U8_9FLAO|nr:hypothetical protein [Leeuwenhoekiella marinoflava]RXG22394.1 hypothetical protein DSL99_3960 [Leeuwenhoekiella marinoflava]SHF31533.1 hypothetical protein SAMN02745246_02169 [Leeuwenhoekiella marinoflava DSM 3653]
MHLLVESIWSKYLNFLTEDIYTSIILPIELLPFIVGLIYWRKFIGTPIIWIILYLGYNFFNELLAAFYFVYTEHANTIFFNIHDLIYFLVIFYVYYRFLKSVLFKRVTILLFIVWMLTYFYFVTTSDVWIQFSLLSLIVGDFLIMVLVLLSFIEIINYSGFAIIKDDFLIYLGLGLLIYIVIQLPVLIVTLIGWMNLSDANHTLVSFFKLIRNLGFAIGCLMYLIFAYGFYRSKYPQLTKD